MTKEKFIKIIERFKKEHMVTARIDDILSNELDNTGIRDFFSAYSFICMDADLIIDLLEECVGDDNELISFCLYEAHGREVLIKNAKSNELIMNIVDAGSLYDAIQYLNDNTDIDYFIDVGTSFTDLAM